MTNTSSTSNTANDGYIVCIGASAGGLAALEQFFTHCPVEMGVTYVVIQHLSSDYKSMMDELISRFTPIHVSMIKDAQVALPNRIYLIAPGTMVGLKARTFEVTEKILRNWPCPSIIF